MAGLTIEELSATNASAANTLTFKPGQEQFAGFASYEEFAPAGNPAAAWQRVVRDGDEVVAYVFGSFDPDADREEFRAILWRITVDAEEQGRGIGTFAVNALADEARARGHDALYVIWEPGQGGPESFFRRVGFQPVGETPYGETVGRLALR